MGDVFHFKHTYLLFVSISFSLHFCSIYATFHEFEKALGVGDGLASLACCSQWGHKELDMTERLN